MKNHNLKLKKSFLIFSYRSSLFSFLFSLFSLPLCLSASLFLMPGCTKSKPTWEYMPDMANSPSLKAQTYDPKASHKRSMKMPVAGTIPRNYQPYPYKEDPEAAGRDLKNPLPRTEEVLVAGQKTFNVHCAVCHGAKGLGDGSVVPKFPKPPSLQSEKVRDWPDGRIYHVVAVGQNLMPSYASQVTPEQRWAVVHYIRALQRAYQPMEEDVEAYKKLRTKR